MTPGPTQLNLEAIQAPLQKPTAMNSEPPRRRRRSSAATAAPQAQTPATPAFKVGLLRLALHHHLLRSLQVAGEEEAAPAQTGKQIRGIEAVRVCWKALTAPGGIRFFRSERLLAPGSGADARGWT